MEDLPYGNLTGLRVGSGKPHPMGPCIKDGQIHLSLFAPYATRVRVLLFESVERELLARVPLDTHQNRSGDVWHVSLEGVPLPCLYAFEVEGEEGRRQLLDPLVPQIISSHEWGQGPYSPLGLLEEDRFDWEAVSKPGHQMQDLIVYEMHVRGFTQDPSSGAHHPGSYLGVIEKIPYLKALGINAVELLPVYEFDETEYEGRDPDTGNSLMNYWGYSPVSFFAPMARYASPQSPLGPRDQFRTMVKALHEAGIEVILDVVYNHTVEKDGSKAVWSFWGLAPEVYYMLDEEGRPRDYTGCGNTINGNHPITRELIRNSLRYWATEMQVDGFRFDLAAALSRSPEGIPMKHPPLLESISEDPVLKDIKLIAEPWDVGGLYQVGGFFRASPRWSEWNGQYRDTIRRFIRGIHGQAGVFAQRLSGSEDLYGRNRSPAHSVNFITAHDGFTLQDLVAYQHKHNLRNGEENRDGLNENESWNCGEEGPSQNREVNRLRERQKRNFFLALMLSQGVPMLLMGDEYGHTKWGNNNTWCQDNEMNWFQWDLVSSNGAWWDFCRRLIELRKTHKILRRDRFLGPEDVVWHDLHPNQPDWSDGSRLVALTLRNPEGGDLYAAFNAADHSTTVVLPPCEEGVHWVRILDTFHEPVWSPATFEGTANYNLGGYSSILLRRAEA